MKRFVMLVLKFFYLIEKNLTHDIAPFASIMIIVVSLLSVVFCKMELRRMGYSILQMSRIERQMRDHERSQMVQLAKITRPERLQSVAEHHLTLRKPGLGQVIQMTEQGVAFRE
jgi:hypothetical protein